MCCSHSVVYAARNCPKTNVSERLVLPGSTSSYSSAAVRAAKSTHSCRVLQALCSVFEHVGQPAFGGFSGRAASHQLQPTQQSFGFFCWRLNNRSVCLCARFSAQDSAVLGGLSRSSTSNAEDWQLRMLVSPTYQKRSRLSPQSLQG